MRQTVRLFGLAALITAMAFPPLVRAHEPEPSIEDTLRNVAERLVVTLEPERLIELKPKDVPALLNPRERERLGHGHVTFEVSVPVVVTLMSDVSAPGEPFWLENRGFTRVEGEVKADRKRFEVWQRRFDAGEVSLGIGSFRAEPYPYFLALRPAEEGDALEVSGLQPRRLKLGVLQKDAAPFVDRGAKVSELPAALDGQVMIRTSRRLTQDVAMLGWFHATDYPSSDEPDHVVLTWSDDPRTTQTVQWRTSPEVERAVVRLREADDPEAVRTVEGRTEELFTPYIVNDSRIHLHSAVITGLEPATTYEYSVGDGEEARWSAWRDFTTAPDGPASFSFIYMGDAQTNLDEWGPFLRDVHHKHPDAAFHILAGDLIDRGSDRDNWDEFFHFAHDVYAHKTFLPALGNHEYLGDHGPELYLRLFNLPQNGATSIETEKSYALEYGDAFFVVLDSNEKPELQSEWLETQLAGTDATWKFAIFHHPVYASHPDRDHSHLLRAWGPIFDKYGVDMVLQGHDHGYLRTYPMKDDKRVTPLEGTYYVVSVSGTKFYPQDPRPYAEVGFTETSTYQLLEIDAEAGTLRYRAFDSKGELRDEVNLTKPAAVPAGAAE